MLLRSLSLLFSLVLTALPAFSQSNYDFRIARLSYIEGHVRYQHAGDVDWSAASINMALQPADRIYTSEDGRAEIQFDDGSILRLAEKTDAEILSLKEEFIQVRILLGLTTLNVESSVTFEVNTPSAAFTTVRKGVYRFDVRENGDSVAVVRKGLLDAANNSFSRRLEAGELVHVSGGERGTHAVSRYGERDQWDEWNDRRNADLVAYESRKYIPEFVSVGVRELDRYGRWVVVDQYGPAWVPRYTAGGWSPYWYGRWYYRPIWGWTWISYEPWGWLPYHYGRWYHSLSYGWCWIPGATFNFHFWSPGLVRFYQGPGWISWCPLGPGDYYNVNNYYFSPTYAYHLNHVRLTQRRGPGDLLNRNAPGAFRTTRIDQFANESLGDSRIIDRSVGIDRPWIQGRIVTDRVSVQPTSRSYLPAPDLRVPSASPTRERPVVVRTEPDGDSSRAGRYAKIAGPSLLPPPASRTIERGASRRGAGDDPPYAAPSTSADRSTDRESGGRGVVGPVEDRSRIRYWNRGSPENPDPATGVSGRTYRLPPGEGEGPGQTPVFGRQGPESTPMPGRDPTIQRRPDPGMSPTRTPYGGTGIGNRGGERPLTVPRTTPEIRNPSPVPDNRFERQSPLLRTPPPTPDTPRVEPTPRRSEPQGPSAASSSRRGEFSTNGWRPTGSARGYRTGGNGMARGASPWDSHRSSAFSRRTLSAPRPSQPAGAFSGRAPHASPGLRPGPSSPPRSSGSTPLRRRDH